MPVPSPGVAPVAAAGTAAGAASSSVAAASPRAVSVGPNAIGAAVEPASGAGASSGASVIAAALALRRTLDPRVKLWMLLLANLLLFFHVDARGEAVLVAMFLIPLFAEGRWRAGLRLGVLYAALLGLDVWSDAVAFAGAAGASGASAAAGPTASAANPATWAHALGLVSVGLRMMLPCIITGAYAFTTTPVSAFVCAMRRMRVPEAVVVPCMVVIRFFPTIARDYRQIRDAMALRGVLSGRFAMVAHPVRALEYVMVPLLMNATVVSRDLSVAALTRGLGVPGAHTSMAAIRMRWFDWLAMLVYAVPLALGVAGVL